MKLTAAVQEALVCLLCYDEGSRGGAQARAVVPLECYDLYYKDIVAAAVEYRDRFKVPPGEHTLDLIEVLVARKPKYKDALLAIYESMEATKGGINADYVLQQASVFARYQSLRRGLGEAVDLLEVETEEGLLQAENALRGCLQSNLENFDPGLLYQDPKQALAFLNRQDQLVTLTGIPEMDRSGVGPKRGELGCLVAPSGRGKSWWLLHLARQALMHRQRVLYVTLELSKDDCAQRLTQMLFSVTTNKQVVRYNAFDKDDLGRYTDMEQVELTDRPYLTASGIEEYLTGKLSGLKRRPPLRIKQYPPGELTIAQLDAYLDAMEASYGFMPDLLLVDYADELATDAKNYRLELGAIYRGLRAIAVRRNIAVETASQTNREGNDVQWVTRKHIGEDYSKICRSDTIIFYSQTASERSLGLARLEIDKARTSTYTGGRILISQAYRTGQFAMDTAAMMPEYWDHVDDGEESRED